MIPSHESCTLPHQSRNIHAVFKRQTLKFCMRDYVHAEPLTIVCFSSVEMCDPSRSKLKLTQTHAKIYMEEKKDRCSKRHLLGHIKHVCNFSGSILRKRREHWALKEFSFLRLNQPVYIPMLARLPRL